MHRLLNTFTLILAATLTLPDNALAIQDHSGLAHVARHRMIKVRRAGGSNGGILNPVLAGGAANAAGDPNQQSNPSATASTGAGGAAATGTPTQGQQSGSSANGNGNGGGNNGAAAGGGGQPSGAQSSAGNSPASTPTSGGGILGPIVGPIVSGLDGNNAANSTSASSSSTISSSSSSSSTSSTTTSQPPSTTPPPALTPASPTSSQSTSLGIVTLTTTGPAAASQTADDPPKKSAPLGTIGKNTIIILAAIAGSIGVAGVIWTIIRKWKFRPSRSFEDRIQPIDWQPTSNDPGFGGGDMRERDITDRALERTASRRSHGSFISAEGSGHHATNQNRSDYLTADLPSHDFTAGPSHLAPVGGYADLQRGPSPQPYGGAPMRAPSPYQYEIPNTYATVQPHQQQQPYYGGYDQQRGY